MEEMSFFKRLSGHLHTINRHRYLVMKMCFKCGMYYQGLTHDLSKYSFQEFWPSVRYYQGYRSPITKEKLTIGYSECWLHHKGRNKHHYEYWIDRHPKSEEMFVIRMPFRYMLESVIDRISASKVYNKDKYTENEPYEFFINSRDCACMNKQTAEDISKLLLYLKENGEKKALTYYKSLYKIHKNDREFTL